jgi:thiol-disulfide isomerase/thioredoxin
MWLMLCVATMAGQPAGGIDLDGKRIDPLKTASGKPAVLVFVRTDCPISNRYAPTLQQLQTEYAGRVAFWLVYPDKDESPAKIRKHLQEYGYAIPALQDPGRELVKLSQAQITPEVAVFGANRKLAYHGRIDNWYENIGRVRAAPTTHELRDALQELLAGNAPKVASARAVGCSITDLQ